MASDVNSTNFLKEDQIRLLFSWTDYLLFVGMLVFSTLIGIYFGFVKKQNTSDKYLLGGKNMGCFPVAISLIASHVSGVTLLGVPSDVYYYGTAYVASAISAAISGLMAIVIILPVFCKLQLANSFQYLEMRFDHKIRFITSFIFILRTILHIPIVIYIPAIAFSQVTGINIHVITPIICSVCIFYTTFGGLKAVVWTDTLQFIITIAAITTVFIMGVIYCGGLENIWVKSDQGGRLDFFNVDPSLTSRCTFWGIVIGLTVNWIMEFGFNQGCIQKFLSIPTLTGMKRSVIFFIIGVSLTKTVCAFMGLIMFTKYQYCDPYSAKIIKKPDQILPYYVMDVSSDVKGLAGLFIAGVFCTALSSMSASLNTLSGTLYHDFIAPFLSEKTDETRASNIMKVCAFLTGVISVLLVFIVEKLGGVLQIAISVSGITAGPIMALFTLAMCVPWVNAKGAFYGSIVGLLSSIWIVFGAQYHKTQGNIKYPKLPVTTDYCNSSFSDYEHFNLSYPTTFDRSAQIDDDVFSLFKLSYMFYSPFGAIVVIVVAVFISWLTGFEDLNKLNPDLITPAMHFVFPKSRLKSAGDEEKGKYGTVEQALEMVN